MMTLVYDPNNIDLLSQRVVMKDYEPFGEDWEKELNKLPKKILIEMYKTKCREVLRCSACGKEYDPDNWPNSWRCPGCY
jgi:hypothetical protein